VIAVDWVGFCVLGDFARQFNSLSIGRAGCQVGLASAWLLLCAGSVHDATALNETRTLSFHHTHSGEDLAITFKREGRYDEAALKQLNHYLRDWRTQDETVMDRHLFDILWEVYRDVDGKKPIQIVSSYRSPATNAMLRRRSSGVARHSQHMLGHAMDFYIPDVPLEQIRYAGLRLQRGGVGFYPTSGSPFVHLDTGGIRHWPRMTHDQLAKVFPDGRTVHIPSDGAPLKGYELARADIEKRDTADDSGSSGKFNLFAALFKGKASDKASDDKASEEDDEADAKPAPVVATATKTSDGKASDNKTSDSKSSSDTKSANNKAADAVKTARIRAAAALQLASADAQLAKVKPAPADGDKADAKPQTVADIINARGFWGNDAAPKQETADQIAAAINARRAVETTDPQQTTGIVPAAYQAMAYVPPSSPSASVDRDRANVVAASAPIPRGARTAASRSIAAATEINSVATKGVQGEAGLISTSARISAARGEGTWLRVLLLAPSVSTSMSVTMLGDADLTQMRMFFVKPKTAIAMSFTDDPTPGLSYDQFSGSAITRLDTTSFVQRSASLQ
jgi:uncharacterized protein YcbK (DUF882 family)